MEETGDPDEGTFSKVVGTHKVVVNEKWRQLRLVMMGTK